MAKPAFTEALRDACPAFAALRASCSPVHTIVAEDRIAGAHALHCATCKPIVQRIKAEAAVRDLTRALSHPVAGDYWLTQGDTSRYSLIAPVSGWLVWLYLVPARAVREAEAAGLIRLGPLRPVPEYRGGQQRYRWQAGQQGHVVTLAASARLEEAA